MISKEKKALLHVAKQQLGLSDEEYRAVLKTHTNMTSSTDPNFTDFHFKEVLDHFKIAYGFQVKRNWEQETRKDPHELPSPQHLKILDHCWEDFAQFEPAAHSRKFREGFNRRIIKKPWPQTRRETNMLIEAMKARLQREYKKIGGPGMGAREADMQLGVGAKNLSPVRGLGVSDEDHGGDILPQRRKGAKGVGADLCVSPDSEEVPF